MEEEGVCDDGDDVEDDDDHDDEDEEDDDHSVNDGDTYDDDEMEGFEDWRLDDEIGDRHGQGYDDDTDWNPDVQEDLPELIYTEGCDEDGVDLAPCISLQRCSNRLAALSTSGGGDGSSGGDVDAVRVMLLGVSDSGRPSVGIDLGYACTQQSNPNARDSLSLSSSSHAHNSSSSSHNTSGSSDHSHSSPHAASAASSPHHPHLHNPYSSANNHGSAGPDASSHQGSPSALSPTMMSRATTRASRPASPFIFQPPRTPSRSPAQPARRSFVFSEWASSNRQTFVFEGSQQREGQDPEGYRQYSPCKFVPTKSLTLAMQDADFVGHVLEGLPGVKTSDPRVVALLDRIREGRTTRPQTPTVGGEREQLSRSISAIRPLLPKRPPSASAASALGGRGSSCRSSLQGPLAAAEGGADRKSVV